MSSAVLIELEMPDDLALFHLPDGVQERLNVLLDKQDSDVLTHSERLEAEGLVDLAELLSLGAVRDLRRGKRCSRRNLVARPPSESVAGIPGRARGHRWSARDRRCGTSARH